MVNGIIVVCMNTKEQAIRTATVAHRVADQRVVDTGAALLTLVPGTPEYVLVDLALDAAMELLDTAADDLREVRDGYRHTYPHPAAKCHRHHAHVDCHGFHGHGRKAS